MEARARPLALVDVTAAVFALVAGRARAVVAVVPVDAPAAVGTGAGGTLVNEGAVLACRGRSSHVQLTV